MNRARSILFVAIVLLFPCIQFADWARTSSIVRVLAQSAGLGDGGATPPAEARAADDKLLPRLRRGDPAARYERRFAPLRPYLPLDRRVGYVTDIGGVFDRIWPFIYAQFALAPAVLVDSEDAGIVVTNFSDESVVDRLARGESTICRKIVAPVGWRGVDERPDELAGVAKPVIAAPRNLAVDFRREVYRCPSEVRFRIARRFGDGVAILLRSAEPDGE